MEFLVIFIQKAIGQGIGILYGALGEILTEKSGNLNLGIPGMMYMGGIAGLMGAFLYENSSTIRYVSWLGVRWKVTNIDIQRPRLILTLGEVYNG